MDRVPPSLRVVYGLVTATFLLSAASEQHIPKDGSGRGKDCEERKKTKQTERTRGKVGETRLVMGVTGQQHREGCREIDIDQRNVIILMHLILVFIFI